MQGVIVEFQFADDFDGSKIAAIAHEARGRFEGMPGLRQKAFTVDERVVEERARGLFGVPQVHVRRAPALLVERVTGLYGVRPTVTFVEVAELVDNG